jgi:hypothetical protein
MISLLKEKNRTKNIIKKMFEKKKYHPFHFYGHNHYATQIMMFVATNYHNTYGDMSRLESHIINPIAIKFYLHLPLLSK